MEKYKLSEIEQIKPIPGVHFIIDYKGNEFEFKPFCYEDGYCIEPDMVAGYNVFYKGEYIRNWPLPTLNVPELEKDLFEEIETNIINAREQRAKDAKKANKTKIVKIAATARKRLCQIVKDCLKAKGTIDVNINFHTTYGEGTSRHITSVTCDEGKIIVMGESDDGSSFAEDLMVYSISEILQIANELVDKC